jgi:predicted nucleotidyltransferase
MKKEIEEKLNNFARVLRTNNIPLRKMFLFGSVARGQEHEWSDIDVGVVSEMFNKNRFDEAVHLRILALGVDAAISPFPLHPDDLNDRFDTVAEAIRREGIEIDIK